MIALLSRAEKALSLRAWHEAHSTDQEQLFAIFFQELRGKGGVYPLYYLWLNAWQAELKNFYLVADFDPWHSFLLFCYSKQPAFSAAKIDRSQPIVGPAAAHLRLHRQELALNRCFFLEKLWHTDLNRLFLSIFQALEPPSSSLKAEAQAGIKIDLLKAWKARPKEQPKAQPKSGAKAEPDSMADQPATELVRHLNASSLGQPFFYPFLWDDGLKELPSAKTPTAKSNQKPLQPKTKAITAAHQALAKIGQALQQNPPSASSLNFQQNFRASAVSQLLNEFWQHHSGGKISQFAAFETTWQNASLKLTPRLLDPAQNFGQLVGLEKNHQALIENTQNFLEGKFFRHTLLWGDRGMGKSSSAVALIDHFAASSLKLLELSTQELLFLPSLLSKLQAYPEKFLLLLDDVRFLPDDPRVGILKRVLAGSLASFSSERADNVLFLVTSNHRDLVMLDPDLDLRVPKNKEVLDEAKALDDRFGLKLYYGAWQFEVLKQFLLRLAERHSYPVADPDSFYQEFLNFCLYNQLDAPSARAIQSFLLNRKN